MSKEPMRRGGVTTIDMHTHIWGRSKDSILKIDELVCECKSYGLDAACITDHDLWLSADEALKFSEELSFNIFNGIEISGGRNGHFLCYGDIKELDAKIDLLEIKRSLEELLELCVNSNQISFKHQDVMDILINTELYRLASGEKALVNRLRLIKGQGGFIVWAHPLSHSSLRRVFDVFFDLYPYDSMIKFMSFVEEQHPDIYEIFQLVDALEGFNGNAKEIGLINKQVLDLAQSQDKPVIGGSDAHDPTGVGRCFTQFDDEVSDVESFLRALRSGNFRPVSIRGFPGGAVVH